MLPFLMVSLFAYANHFFLALLCNCLFFRSLFLSLPFSLTHTLTLLLSFKPAAPPGLGAQRENDDVIACIEFHFIQRIE